MNCDEFAFFNEQLASMLRDGIPLEGAIERLCRDVRRGSFAADFQAVAGDLARGVPLADALAGKRLPDLYVHMVRVGAAGNDLPAVLRLLADYYRHVGSVWTRLKGLLFYPAIVLLLTVGLSLLLVFYLGPILEEFVADMRQTMGKYYPVIETWTIRVLLPPGILTLAGVVALVAAALPPVRRRLRWRISPFKDASLAQAASGLSLMLRGGCSLDDALRLVSQLERGTRAGAAFRRLRVRLAEGHGRFGEMAETSRVFPALFTWVVDQGGEDMAAGFERAARLYRTRAAHRTEMLLYAALPVSILLLGGMLFLQLASVAEPLNALIKSLFGQF